MDSTSDGRVLNEVILLDHAHPENVPGHGMKGGVHMSTGYLLNPEMKKFQINTPIAFFPPAPTKTAGYVAAASAVPTFGNFFSAYFGGQTSYNMGNPAAGKMLENLKKCYETHESGNPEEACAYYIDGFKRLAC